MSTRTAGKTLTPDVDDVRAEAPSERLLEDSWSARSRRPPRRELIAEGVAALPSSPAPCRSPSRPRAATRRAPGSRPCWSCSTRSCRASSSRSGPGYVVPSYLVLVPMLVLLPPGLVPLLVAAGLMLGALGQWVCRPTAGPSGSSSRSRTLGTPSARRLVLIVFADVDGGLGPALVYIGAFAAACLFDLVSATLREAAAMDVPPRVQIGVLARVWAVDACLAPDWPARCPVGPRRPGSGAARPAARRAPHDARRATAAPASPRRTAGSSRSSPTR